MEPRRPIPSIQDPPRSVTGSTDLCEFDIRDIDKILLPRVLYEHARITTTARPARPFDYHLAHQVLSAPTLTTDLPDVGSWLTVHSFCGRIIAVALTKNTAQGWIYDQLNGPGSFERAVHRARYLTAEVARRQGGDPDQYREPEREREGERERERTPPPPYSERER